MSEPPKSGGSTPHQQIIDELVSMVGERGYLQTKVSDLTARSGVARSHFYELFTDKEDCFLSAQRELASAILAQVRQRVAHADPAAAAHAAVAALAELADREPAAFALLTHETTLAGPRAWQERERMIAAISEEIERTWAQLPARTPIPDLAPRYLLGGAMRALGIRMRRGEQHPERLQGELITWVDAYRVPKRSHRWSSITASSTPRRGGERAALGPIEPPALPRGRHRLPPATAKRTQRERIVHATGSEMSARGYDNTTVAEIVATAGVSREVFYEQFRDKREAFAETVKFVFEQIIAASAGAFFSTAALWPERIWEACEAYVEFIVGQASLVRGVFVEPYAGDVQRPDDFLVGFTVFLEDGYRHRPEAAQIPRLAGEAIGGAVLEAINVYLRSGRAADLPELIPGVAYTVLAPFLGPDDAYQFVVNRARGR